MTANLAIKAPCVVATNSSITLSGEQTVNGVAVVADDRVLVKDQTNAVENGIYDVGTSGWVRTTEFDGSDDVMLDTVVVVGSSGSEPIMYRVTGVSPFNVGTSEIALESFLTGGLWEQTQTEIDAGVTPVSLKHAPGNVRRYGADPTGVGDSSTAFQNAMDMGHAAYVPAGRYLIEATVTIDKPKIIECQGHAGMKDPSASVGANDFDEQQVDIRPGSDINVFSIEHEDVHWRGGRISFQDVSSPTKACFYFPGILGPSTDGGWGFSFRDITCVGDGSELHSSIGGGAIGFHFDFETQTTVWAFWTHCHIDMIGVGLGRCVYISPKNPGKNQWMNTFFVNIEALSCKQAWVNHSCNTAQVKVIHQASRVLHADEYRTLCSVEDSTNSLKLKFKAFDFGKGEGDPGEFQNEKTLNLTGINLVIEDIDSFSEGRSIAIHDRKSLARLDKPRGFIPWVKNTNGLNTPWKNQFFEHVIWSGTTISGTGYDGTAVTTNTNVTDAVFLNASDRDVDITSAGGNLPSLATLAIFEVTNHSVAGNNGAYQVAATVTDGYTCTKLSRDGSSQAPDPVDSASEIIDTVEGLGSIVTDSVTATIPTSADVTVTDAAKLVDKHTASGTVAVWTAQGVSNNDYAEIVVNGASVQMSKLYLVISNGDDVRPKQIQLIRGIGGTPTDNILIDVPDAGESAPLSITVYEFDLSGSGASSTLIRLIGANTAGQVIGISDIQAFHFYDAVAGQFLERDGGVIHGDLKLKGDNNGVEFVRTANADGVRLESIGGGRIAFNTVAGGGGVDFNTGLRTSDNVSLWLGTGNDSKLYCTGFNVFWDTGGSRDVFIRNGSGNRNAIVLDGGGQFVALYQGGNRKLVTKADGINVEGNIFVDESEAAADAVTAQGQFWVRHDAPNTPMFTDDAGNDFDLTASDQAIATATTPELEDISDAINTGVAKVPGYQVFNTTTGAPVWSVGDTNGGLWNDATGTTAHTPI